MQIMGRGIYEMIGMLNLKIYFTWSVTTNLRPVSLRILLLPPRKKIINEKNEKMKKLK